MITEQDLKAAIAECQGERNPDARTCMKLAAYYIILEHLEDKDKAEIPTHSYEAPTQAETVKYNGKSEFSELVNGRPIIEVMPHIEELVTAVREINPRLYEVFMRRFRT